ncbi:hypothetical protein GCM10011339_45010 [Echinicola rosea]|uniref:O-antigen ligase domain-containing protein n=2 Tax=Echinicola rosea TaxID=1807691 RepID=A0ABQ1VD07_9BACT|nr:hypothetical protein GCM10011339_45010 [Echinicola rosea]
MVEILKDNFIIYCLLVIVFVTFEFFIVTKLFNSNSLVFIQQNFWFITEAIIGTYLLYQYLSIKYTNDEILYGLLVVIFIQSIFVIISFISKDFRDFTNLVLKINDERYLSNYRMKGFSNSGGAGLSYLQTIGAFSGCILFLKETRKVKKIKVILFVSIIVLSQIFIARTGLIFSAILFVVTMVQEAINKSSVILLIKRVAIIIITLIIGFIGLFFVIPKEKITYFEEKVISRAFELIEVYQATGELETSSTNNLQTMFFLPNDPIKLMIGAGDWDGAPGTRNYFGRKVDSDVGYVRAIFAVGIIFTILFYSIYIVYIINLFNNSKKYSLVLLGLLFVFFLGEFKEPFLIRTSGTVKSLFLIYFTLKEGKN